jgi:hypothetical protein
MLATPLEANSMREVGVLLEEGRRLQSRLAELGAQLRQAAVELEQGHPPSPELVAGLAGLSQAFHGLLERAQHLLGEVPIEPLLPRILEALEARHKVLEGALLRQKALDVLERVSGLVYQGGGEFLPLSSVQFDALGMLRQQRERADLDETFLALASGTHPYNLLLRLVADKGMSNEEWARAYQQVGQALGQELAVAAARGQICLPE